MFGELWAKHEREALNRYFGFTEWVVHTLVLFIWCCSCKLIVPFVLIYTQNVTDVNYNVPVFAVLLCIAYALYCIRLPFNVMILAAGHYKNTQCIYVMGALMNLILSALAVHRWGLVGVTVGTIAAMLYQVMHMGYYVLHHLKVHSFRRSAKQFAVDGITIALFFYLSGMICCVAESWIGWLLLAVKHVVVIVFCIIVINLIFYYNELQQMIQKVVRRKDGTAE